MADVYAIANGNWSDPAIWSGSTVPGTADNVWLNGKTITLDQDISVASLSSEANATLGTVAGGTLDIPSTYSTRTITASGDIKQGGTTYLITVTNSTVLTITATTLLSSDTGSQGTIRITNGGAFQITVNATVVARNVVVFDHPGTTTSSLVIQGDVFSIGPSYAISTYARALGNIVINGNVKNGGIRHSDYGLFTINGNVISEAGLASLNPIEVGGGGGVKSITINGNVIAGPLPAITLNSANTTMSCVINGNVTGGSANGAPGILVAGMPTGNSLKVNGDVYNGSGANSPGIFAKVDIFGSVFVNGNLKVSSLTDPATPSVSVPRLTISNAQTRYIEHWEGDISTGQPTGNKLIFETNINASQANPADVRQGVVYGPAGEYTGTCAVPPPQSVAYGVPVDNTVGQAGLPPYRAVAEYRGG
ncbi:MAG: hypothetical protein KatS3mg038_0408 [Candidatus Kapaibacterium sp.]|nr:MAG: hypothetical protein KatS3mg038_0408 [Candidatus Kapabacteria bacterium]